VSAGLIPTRRRWTGIWQSRAPLFREPAMPYAGLRNDSQRADVVGYLATLK
jgi:hypothetical protein